MTARRALIVLLLAASPAIAQQRDDRVPQSYELENQQLAASGNVPVTRTVEIGTGQIGKRQTRGEVAANVAPLDRIASRIDTRVQNRLRNRIDRYYDPKANATWPFIVAGDQARRPGRHPR